MLYPGLCIGPVLTRICTFSCNSNILVIDRLNHINYLLVERVRDESSMYYNDRPLNGEMSTIHRVYSRATGKSRRLVLIQVRCAPKRLVVLVAAGAVNRLL